MNNRTLILVFVYSVYSIFCFSQENDSVKIKKTSLNLKISYNSSLIYPGALLGIEFPFKTTNVTKYIKQGKVKSFISEQVIAGNISWYHHPSFHDNVYLTAGWTTRRTKSKCFITEFSPELGISRTFLGATTYKVNNNGNVSIEKLAGYYYAFISVGGGIGYDFSETKLKPLVVFYKFNFITMFPYNSTIYLRPAMEIGVIYKTSCHIPLKRIEKSQNR